jgi:hypothetical protein
MQHLRGVEMVRERCLAQQQEERIKKLLSGKIMARVISIRSCFRIMPELRAGLVSALDLVLDPLADAGGWCGYSLDHQYRARVPGA